ncbi:Rieske (2Fe-2S) protein [Streptomyces sp. TRM 70351]|uniref:Rieske (2Fe-2S) protein n=1 Tax=Streptomyces sp. TRM 70351 TaxID=3116552 RepID=UPI002E7B9A97|nr:Rieske (2Fe-2S) protein [Streptomyces sp. TRM 70351]MEE1930545.1 Rieske (2Fe-2S) protein [Streptomyces sp. TRM 70351]
MTANHQHPGRRALTLGAAAGAVGLGAGCAGPGASRGAEPGAVPSAPVALGSAADVPVGGAKVFPEQRLLVSQTEPGAFRAFSAVCTHQGCAISTVRETAALCPCHGSGFDATTGEVLYGPAREPLPEVPVRVSGDGLVAG